MPSRACHAPRSKASSTKLRSLRKNSLAWANASQLCLQRMSMAGMLTPAITSEILQTYT